MASAYAVLQSLTPEFLADVQQKGLAIMHDLVQGSQNLQQVKAVRGLGLMIGIELTTDVQPVLMKLRERGILALSAQGNTLRLLPVLTMDEQEMHAGVMTILTTIGEA